MPTKTETLAAAVERRAELIAIAKAATQQGEWVTVEPGSQNVLIFTPKTDSYGVVMRRWVHATPRDRDHMTTFDPPTVLSLLTALEEAEREKNEWKTLHDRRDADYAEQRAIALTQFNLRTAAEAQTARLRAEMQRLRNLSPGDVAVGTVEGIIAHVRLRARAALNGGSNV